MQNKFKFVVSLLNNKFNDQTIIVADGTINFAMMCDGCHSSYHLLKQSSYTFIQTLLCTTIPSSPPPCCYGINLGY